MDLQGILTVVVCFIHHIENAIEDRQGCFDCFLWDANILKQTKQNDLAFGVKETQGLVRPMFDLIYSTTNLYSGPDVYT